MSVYLTAVDIATLCSTKPVQKRVSYTLKCPAHKDRTASLRVSQGHKGTLIYCHTGCSLTDICIELEIAPEQLFKDYNPNNNNAPMAYMKLKDMIKQRTPPNRWELECHQSFQDVVYEVMDVSPQVWATVSARWYDELEKPFMDVWNQPNTVAAIVADLLEEHLDKGWDYTMARRHELGWKIWEEWEAHREQGTEVQTRVT